MPLRVKLFRIRDKHASRLHYGGCLYECMARAKMKLLLSFILIKGALVSDAVHYIAL